MFYVVTTLYIMLNVYLMFVFFEQRSVFKRCCLAHACVVYTT